MSETIEGRYGVRAYIQHDPDATSPDEWCNVGTVSTAVYSESVYRALRLDHPGMPAVYRHEYGSQGWAIGGEEHADAVWVATPDGIADTGVKPENVQAAVEAEAAEWVKWANGDTWRIAVTDEHGHMLDEVGGFIGFEYAQEEAGRMLAYAEEAVVSEAQKVAYWNARDVVTVSA
jgi:hypothetical protein